LEYPDLVKRVIQLILLSSLVVSAKDDGFITATDSDKESVKVEETETKDESEKDKKDTTTPPKPTESELKEFYTRVEGYQFMDPKLIELARLILEWNIEGADFKQETYEEDTKWLAIYKKEMQIAEDNLDMGAYIFFFQEHVHLVIKRAGMSVKSGR
jgi:hypothetical protein